MVAKEGVTLGTLLQTSIAEGNSLGVLSDDEHPHQTCHETNLEILRFVDAHEGQTDEAVAQALRQPGHSTLQHFLEMTVAQQIVQSLLHLTLIVGTDGIEGGNIVHME